MRFAAVGGACAAALLFAPAPARAGDATPIPEGRPRIAHYTFAGVPWLTTADSVVAILKSRGYAETPGSRQKDRLHCAGKLFDHWSIVHGMLDDQGRLIRWEISVPAVADDPYPTQRRLYDETVVEMESKYGRRRVVEERFRFPYERGDGREAVALREGSGTVRSEWGSRGRDRLMVALDRNSDLVLTYESSWWTRTENERRRKKAKDL